MAAAAAPVDDKVARAARLPEQWAAELERAGAEPFTFDARLDRFLVRFHAEIVRARNLKESLDAGNTSDDAKTQLRESMARIQKLMAGEGKEFFEGLERRDPTLTAGIRCGENTIELANGIERLESAVREEEASRRRMRRRPSPASIDVMGREKSFEAGHPLPVGADGRTLPPGVSGLAALPNMNSDETLQLMQSDIQALKLELMRLQAAKNAGVPLGSNITPSDGTGAGSGSTFSMSSVSPESKPMSGAMRVHATNSSALPPPTTASAARLGSALQGIQNLSKPNVTRVAGKPSSLAPSYVSHLEQMKSRLDALEKKPLSRTSRRKSHARLGRTRTMGSLYDTPALSMLDENANPNVTAMNTPPRIVKVPGSPNSHSPDGDVFVSAGGSLDSTPSPPRGPGANGRPSTGSKLFIDGPEELLKRPQSYAATRDMQRYSLKVARRIVGESGGTGPPPHVVEPRSKSAITTSPRKRTEGLGLPPSDHAATLASLSSAAPPSTIDTNGSGGRVVEEMEGEMLVRKGVLWKRWRRRYASIVSHQFFGRVLCLFSYDSSGGVNSARSQIIVLRDGMCRGVRPTVEVNGIERFQFVLRTAAKEYYFAADSVETRSNWVRELRDAARTESVRNVGSRIPSQVKSIFS